MAKKKKEALLTPEQKLEADYQKAVRRMEGAEKMLQAEDRMHMYREAIRLFEDLGGYQDSAERIKACEKSLVEKRKEFREEVYQNGMQLKEQAKTPEDYDAAIEEFGRLKVAYKDIPQQIEACGRLKADVEKREKKKKAGKTLLAAAVLAAVAALVLYLRTPAAFYREGKLLMGLGDYERAANLFKNSREYADTKERLKECNYQRALTCEKEGDYERAVMLLKQRVGDYKDAAAKTAELEKKILAAAKAGDVVMFGNTKWALADTDGRRALLVKWNAVRTGNVYQRAGETADWENSVLRAWLNGDYFHTRFSEAEQAMVEETAVTTAPNSVYGTGGAAASTDDRVFLLDEAEAEKYGELLRNDKNQKEWWLRTMGQSETSAAFVSADGAVMPYGYAADTADIAVRPAMWVSF